LALTSTKAFLKLLLENILPLPDSRVLFYQHDQADWLQSAQILKSVNPPQGLQYITTLCLLCWAHQQVQALQNFDHIEVILQVLWGFESLLIAA